MNLSNISIIKSGFRPVNLDNFLYNINTVLFACSASVSWVWKKLPLVLHTKPRYGILFEVVNNWPSKYHSSRTCLFPFLNTKILDLLVFIFNFHLLQWSFSLSISDCRPGGVSLNITKSSAKNNKRSLKSIIDTPALSSNSTSSKSFTYMANRKGERHSPCLTPSLHSKSGDFSPSVHTLVLTLLYIDMMISSIFPQHHLW